MSETISNQTIEITIILIVIDPNELEAIIKTAQLIDYQQHEITCVYIYIYIYISYVNCD